MIASVELSKDRRLAATVSLGTATIVFLVLHFLTYRIPMPPLPEQLKYQDMEAEFVELTPESLPETAASGGGGGGDEVNAPKSDKFEEQMEEVAQSSNSNFSHQSGKSNHTNTDKPTQNGSSTKNPDDNPFNNDGGSGDGSGGGNGGGIGKDNGDTKGGGNGNGNGAGKRPLVKQPNTDDINSDEDCKITYKVQIAADGSVISARVVYGGGTTTSNTNLINKGAALIKAQARYTSAPKGTAIIEKEFVLRLQPE